MALVISGFTKCPICGNVIDTGQEIVAFQAFASRTSPLWVFSDAALHKSCFDSHPLSGKALQIIKEHRENLQHICAVCREKVVKPDDYFATFRFTENETSPLYKYRYLEFHRHHLAEWVDFDYFYAALRDAIQSEKSDYDRGELEWIATEIEKIVGLSGS